MPDIPRVVKQFLPSCLMIKGENDDSTWTGSGFILNDDGYVLTCMHVVTPSYQFRNNHLRAVFSDAEIPLQVLHTNHKLDAAVLQLGDSGLDVQPAPLGSTAVLDVGDQIVVIGSPDGVFNVVSAGVVATDVRKTKGLMHPALFIDAEIHPGSSGGPAIDVENAFVIGIARGAVGGEVNYVLPIDPIRMWLNEKEVKYDAYL